MYFLITILVNYCLNLMKRKNTSLISMYYIKHRNVHVDTNYIM